MAGLDPPATLDDVDWSALHAASGPADEVPQLLRDLTADDPARRTAALGRLWETVWHQGTVYDVTPAAVPFLVGIAADHRLSDGIRAEVALLLASIGAASSFVLADRWFVASFARDVEDPVPDVELDRACRDVLADAGSAFTPVLAAGPPRVRTAAIAVVATVASSLSADARGALTVLARSDDPLVATAAGVATDLADGVELSARDLLVRAAVDAESVEFLEHIPSWPPEVQAVELVRELCERAVSASVSSG